MVTRIRVYDVDFGSPDRPQALCPGEDGGVFYELLDPCMCESRCEIDCADHPGMHHRYMRQGFARDGPKFRPDATEEEKRTNRANIWGWDGNRESPSLTPSFLCNYPAGGGLPAARVHLYLRAGKIELCSDSTVTL